MQFKNFIKSKGVLIAFLAIIIYGISIFFIYNSGYSGMPKQVNHLPITIVNQDQKAQNLTQKLKSAVPFKDVKVKTNLNDAKRDFKSQKSYMVINIPSNFSSRVKHNQKAKLNFYINDSVQSTVASSMNQAASRISSNIDKNITVQKSKAILIQSQMKKLNVAIQTKQNEMKQEVAQQKAQIAALPVAQQQIAAQQLQQKVNDAQKQSQKEIQSKKNQINQKVNQVYTPVENSISTNIYHENKIKTGLNRMLAPFFANLAIYLGSMLGMLLLYSVYAKYAKIIGRVMSFIDLELTIFLLSIIGSLIVSGVIALQVGNLNSGFVNLFINHAILAFGAYNINAIAILLLGQMGTGINIFLTMLQVVAGAGMVPVQAMNGFFKFAHNIAPMYYGIQSDFSIMYGGQLLSNLWEPAIILCIGLIVVNLIIIIFRKNQPMTDFSSLG
ncbi:hypothetical protein WR164_02720 [Philodulcilactobacillus myokoensis]|uniref:ABC-2 type transporter transmembrane domain-containing protein n=1 Tax=Philodulcilactobacillus myokoensis TaxID=2929573 RepID=A0A9W6B095_9LACO|nr:ABC transporter permease [Philodulcilactobacillus myokoensis]GLB46293.1 hypothetical protein WR164_02720 [Philodulcilactobacillus myokoensis]